MSVSIASGVVAVAPKTIVAGTGITIDETDDTITINSTGGGGGTDMATFDTTLDFVRGDMVATATIPDATMTDTKIIQAFYQNDLDEVAVLNMRVNERSRTAGVGFDVIGVAPNGAFGTYNVRCIVSGS